MSKDKKEVESKEVKQEAIKGIHDGKHPKFHPHPSKDKE